MPEASCASDRTWSFSSPNRDTVLEHIVKKHKSEMVPDGSGVKGNLSHVHNLFKILEDDGCETVIIAQEGVICTDPRSTTHVRRLRTDNSGSE